MPNGAGCRMGAALLATCAQGQSGCADAFWCPFLVDGLCRQYFRISAGTWRLLRGERSQRNINTGDWVVIART